MLTKNDHVLKGDLNTTNDRVVDQKVYPVPGYTTTSALGKVDPAHQEVPMVYSAGNPDNYVVPVFTPDKKETIAEKVHAAMESMLVKAHNYNLVTTDPAQNQVPASVPAAAGISSVGLPKK